MSVSVCFVTNKDLSGSSGGNIATREILNAFAIRDDVDLHLVAPKPSGSAADDVIHQVENVQLLPEKRGSMIWHLQIQFHLLRCLRNCRRVDVLVCRSHPSLILPALFADINDLRYVLLVRGISSINGRVHSNLAPLSRLVIQKNVRSADSVVVAYDEIKSRMIELGWNVSDKVFHFPNAVDVSKFSSTDLSTARSTLDLPFTTDDFVIGFVGSLRKRHQLRPLLEGLLECQTDNFTAKCLIVGDGPQRESLEAFVESEGLASEVVFTGHVPHDEVAKYISSCDVLYGATDEKRPSNPIKCYEYLACQRPIITSKTHEFEFVERIEAGITLNEVNKITVANSIVDIHKRGRSERLEMGRRGRIHVREHYTWSQIVDHCLTK